MSVEEKQAMLDEAEEMLARAEWQLRSCGNCNAAHAHLMDPKDGPLINCFDCAHWFLRGVDLSEIAGSWGEEAAPRQPGPAGVE